ncbi:unnamed protein product [Oppiella nova]|uniref:EGF-like domain-containing protein n=1 Tax=Oppiella nova TaxID=334625 RepID=A0A7R9LE95_9ACAR|nr:unnamed protein product [Oppiella nova]CAG2162785.1 unnamed protein product [Oppiella nova]
MHRNPGHINVADKNLDTNNVCPDGLDETVTDVIRCKCEGIYKLDPATNTCVLKPVCSEGAPGYIDCKSRNAYCYYEKVDGTNNELEYNCTCRDGTEEISDGSHRCVNKCDIDYDDNGITGNVKCRSRNALGCNPLRLIEIATVDYCDCDIGYTWDSKDKMCLVAAKSGTFTLTFKPITKMDEGLEKVKNVFTIDDRAQLNAMFKYVGISGSFQTEYNSAVKQNQIVRDAISVEYRNRTAANFITNQLSKFLVTDVDNAMVTQCELVQSESYGCESNKSVCDLWSDCIPDTDPSLYKCVCNPAYFTATGSQEVPTSDNTKSIYKEKCASTLCDDCHKISDAQCIQALPVYDTDKQTWTANVSCACEDQFKIEGHKCVGVCDGIQCNEGKSAVACKCNEGWYGDNCDKKISVSDEPALGGWIAGVSVLAVVCIMLVVVAFIFYKKYVDQYMSKKVKHRDNNSVQQMNDYSNTSYRVGQHNGNNNDGFNRD